MMAKAIRCFLLRLAVSHPFVGIQLGTVPSWRQATERIGADGKTRGLSPPPARRSVPPELAVRTAGAGHGARRGVTRSA